MIILCKISIPTDPKQIYLTKSYNAISQCNVESLD